MAGPLNSIFAAVEPLILANMTYLSLASPTFGHTGGERYEESAPPRIVWVPTEEDIGPATGQGGDIVVDGKGNQNLPGSAQPPLYTRLVDVEVDLWGADRDSAEAMIPAFTSAVHDALSQGAYGIKGARWLEPEEKQKDGEVYRIVYRFMVPIPRVAPGTTTAVVSTIPLTNSSTFHPGS